MSKEKPSLCPKCKDPKLTLWHNKGVSEKNGKPWENYKCKCGYVQWVDLDKVPGTNFEKPAQPKAESLDDAILLSPQQFQEGMERLWKFWKP